jgi:hypothetical protein
MWSEVRYSPASFSRTPSSSGSTRERKSCGGSPPQRGFHIHLCPMAQTLRRAFDGSAMPARVAATMSQCSNALAKRARLSGLWRRKCSSLANPHSWEYTPPHHSMASSLSAWACAVISCASLVARWSHHR